MYGKQEKVSAKEIQESMKQFVGFSEVFQNQNNISEIAETLSNIANNAKGSPSASPNPPIPAVSSHAAESLEIDPARSDPNIGPVQEKDTIANVRAMKNIPIIPPADSLLVDLSTQDVGRDNS